GAVTVSQGKDTSFTITNSSVVVEVDNPGNSGALSAIAPILTTLTLKNMSFTDLQEVRWQGVSFAGNPLEDALTIGATVSQTVSPGYGYIYFKRKTNPAVVRSKEVITINTNEAKEFVFTDSTLIVETNNPDNMGTLKDMPTTVIFFDDAEGEVQGYAERRDSAYYAAKTDLPGYVASSSYNFYEPRAGSRSIAVGGSGDAKLQLNVTLNRAARLSFWYATKGDGTSHNAAFSIDGDPPENTWSGNINWSQVQYSLSAGSHQLIWTKIGHTTGNNYYYLSLDDILIVYTE
ncbi:MAG: hypothetical protein LBQ61_10085, partial [Spirochaetales bacterium]|nr:hypothetical protein [Spirochaetales bacterium]